MDPSHSHYSSQRTSELSDPAMAPIKAWIESYVVWTELPKHTRASILKRASKGEQEALDALVNHNLRLLLSRAVKQVGRGVPLPDLIQEGWFGLREAAQKYEPQRGRQFSTMAVFWIDQKLKYATVTQGRTLYLPHHAVEKLTRIARRVRQGEEVRADDQQWMDDLARMIWHNPELHNVSLDYFDHLLRGTSSIDKPMFTNAHGGAEAERSLSDILPAPSDSDPSDSLDIEQILVKMVNLGIIRRRDGWLVVRYFGLDGKGGSTYRAMAQELAAAATKAGIHEDAISHQRIEQIISRTVRKIRRYCQAHGQHEVVSQEDERKDEPDQPIDLEALDLKAILAEMVSNGSLSQRYSRILTLRCGLGDNRKQTFSDIAQQLYIEAVQAGIANPESQPVSSSRIRYLFSIALRKVRQYVQTNGIGTFTLPTASGSDTLRGQTKGSQVLLSPAKVKSTESPNRSTRNTSVNDLSQETAASRSATPVRLRAKSSTKRARGSSRPAKVSAADVPYAKAI